MNSKINELLDKAKIWQSEFTKLRAILLDLPLTEKIKWGQPCYTLGNKNIVLMHSFKDYCALLFFKGALMKDPAGILVQQTENVQASRQLRFTSVKEITALKATIRDYVLEAIELEKSGAKVALKKTEAFAMPDELRARLGRDSALKAAFEALTPGRQRAYLLFFSAAKQSKTREARIEKSIPKIFDGLGPND
jgi:uncharacterized protein YdeI (YjbR/CyaY-like superfamily)